MSDSTILKSITVLKLKVQSSSADLREIALLCRKGRNAALEDWLLRQRGKPESAKQAKPSTRKTKQFPNREERPLSESTKIYHAITAAVPELGTTQASKLGRELYSHLSSKLDWRVGKTEDGKRPKRSDAILAYEDRPPFFTALEIPLLSAATEVIYGDRLTICAKRLSDSAPTATIELSLKEIPPAVRAMLSDISIGKRKLADSKVLYKEKNDAWYWHLPITFESERRSDVEVTLWPVIGNDGNRDRPFRLSLPSGRDWWLGEGRYLRAQVKRLTEIRKQVGHRYRQRMGAGHGRKKVDAAVVKRRQQQHNVFTEFRRRIISDAVKQCVRANAGVMIYREPSLPLRKKCWFEAVGLEFDWTRFGSDLKNACARQGIEVVTKQWKWKDAIPKSEETAA